jgi:transcription elongation factor Elf1
MPITIKAGSVAGRTYTITCSNCQGIYKFEYGERITRNQITVRAMFNCPCCERTLSSSLSDQEKGPQFLQD